MNKKTAIVIFITVLFAAGFLSLQLFSYPGGAPAGKTGSPSDAKTCMACHNATLKTQDGMITSDAVSNFYEPGKTYTIKASAKGSSGVRRIGFEISPQNTSGKLVGTLVLTNTDETKLIGKGKYITHTDKGSTAQGSKDWTFSWKAPQAGSGDVTFYGAFMVSESSQLVFTSTLLLKEKK
jgi:hypothetical protein